jgi:hypothetical protein
MMDIMDKHLTCHPTEGINSMGLLLRSMGYPIGPKRIRRLFRIMGSEKMYRCKNLTKCLELYRGVQDHIAYYHQKTHHTTLQTPDDRLHQSIKTQHDNNETTKNLNLAKHPFGFENGGVL